MADSLDAMDYDRLHWSIEKELARAYTGHPRYFILEYKMEFHGFTKVEEIFLFCRARDISIGHIKRVRPMATDPPHWLRYVWEDPSVFHKEPHMKQREIAPGVLMQTGPDPDHVNLVVRVHGREWRMGSDTILLKLPIRNLVEAILEVQAEYDEPKSPEPYRSGAGFP